MKLLVCNVSLVIAAAALTQPKRPFDIQPALLSQPSTYTRAPTSSVKHIHLRWALLWLFFRPHRLTFHSCFKGPSSRKPSGPSLTSVSPLTCQWLGL